MKARFFIVMGVSGSGKTVVGKALAKKLAWDFFDADDFHPAENIAKMAADIPITDRDRVPWLDRLHDLIASRLRDHKSGVLACSALKQAYRKRLLAGNPLVQVVFLKGSYDLIMSRMEARAGHFMKPEMLQSQFATLEEPRNALVVDILPPVEKIVENISAALNLTGSSVAGKTGGRQPGRVDRD